MSEQRIGAEKAERAVTKSSLRGIGRCVSLLALSAAIVGVAQGPSALTVFHPSGAPLAYDVTTVKPVGPDRPYGGSTLRGYISGAFGVSVPWGMQGVMYSGARVLGGPAWIDDDRYEIVGKAADDLRVAMEKMPASERTADRRTMQQALLADRFHLKVHFETREMQIFELVPAKGGLKIKPTAPPPAQSDKPLKPGEMPSGSANMSVNSTGATILTAHTISIDLFLNALRGQSPDVGGRPIVDKTGFEGNFDLTDFRFPGLSPPLHGPGAGTAGEPDTPSLAQALEEKLGMKLVPAKAQVELVIIDSIDRPTEN
jgi:uncharacterized protein (TIGR03435 family)